MKKYRGIILIFFCVLAFAACGSDKKIVLPEAENISEIEIVQNTSERGKKITDPEEIEKIISEIKDHTKAAAKESVNDQPVNVDDYLIVSFHHKNAEGSPSEAYLYTESGKSYVEQPYAGIWELKNETYDRIGSDLEE